MSADIPPPRLGAWATWHPEDGCRIHSDGRPIGLAAALTLIEVLVAYVRHAATHPEISHMARYDIAALRRELRRDEALRLVAYLCSAGKLTIGYGHTDGVRGGDTCTQEQAERWLDQDIEIAAAGLDRALPWWRSLSDARQRVLLNMSFNLGLPRLLGFKRMLYALSIGDYPGAAVEALNSKWAGQVGNRATRLADMISRG